MNKNGWIEAVNQNGKRQQKNLLFCFDIHLIDVALHLVENRKPKKVKKFQLLHQTRKNFG